MNIHMDTEALRDLKERLRNLGANSGYVAIIAIEQLERELAHKESLLKHLMAQCEATDNELAAEKALADRLDETLKKADEALHDDGCRPTMWPRPQIAEARAAYRKARGL